MLHFLQLFWDIAGKYENLTIALPVMKTFAKVHNCLELWQHFLTVLESDDKKLSVFTSYVFKDLSFEYPDFVENTYLPALLHIAEKEQFVVDRMESIQSGLSLLRLHQKRMGTKVPHMLEVIEQCVRAGISSVEEAKDKMPEPKMVLKQQMQLQMILN